MRSLLILIVAIILMLCSGTAELTGTALQAGNSVDPSEGEETEGTVFLFYEMEMPETSGEELPYVFLPSLYLNEEDGTFSFGYDLLSSYLSYGTYEIEEGILTANTIDGRYTYLFRVMENGNLAFIEKGSSEVRLTDSRLGIPVEDGSVFIKK